MVFSFIKKGYELVKHMVQELKKAHFYKISEYNVEFEKINKREQDFFRSKQVVNANLCIENERARRLKKSVQIRYFDNILRVFKGYSLVQDEEKELGIGYSFNGYSDKFYVTDKNKYVEARNKLNNEILGINKNSSYTEEKSFCKSENKKVSVFKKNNFDKEQDVSLESKVSDVANNYSLKEKSNINETDFNFVNYTSSNSLGEVYVARHIHGFREDCFTNILAKFSNECSGSVKKIADSLSGYVRNKDSFVAPHKRSWSSRVDALEDLLLENNFTRSNTKKLLEIKEALSKNKYLITKRKEAYERAVSLIDKAVRRYNYVV